MARKSLKDLMAQLDQPRVQKIKERRTDGQRPSIEEWMGIDSASEPDVLLSKSSKLSAEDWLHATVPATGAVPAGRTPKGKEEGGKEEGAEDEDADELDYSEAQEEDENGTCEWPKLDIKCQFFSSKEEPMMLCKEPPAQVSCTRTESQHTLTNANVQTNTTQNYTRTRKRTRTQTHTRMHKFKHINEHTHIYTLARRVFQYKRRGPG